MIKLTKAKFSPPLLLWCLIPNVFKFFKLNLVLNVWYAVPSGSHSSFQDVQENKTTFVIVLFYYLPSPPTPTIDICTDEVRNNR